MGFDILLDSTGDLPHRPILGAGIDVTAQRVRLRLLRFRGDLVLNVKKGIDYPGLIQARPVDTDMIEALIVGELAGTEGLKSITSIAVVFAPLTGEVTVTVEILTDEGEESVEVGIFGNQGIGSVSVNSPGAIL